MLKSLSPFVKLFLCISTLHILSYNDFQCEANTIEEELVITPEELLALEDFRREVEDIVPHDYMKEDIYLIRWLRFRNLDVKKAKLMLFNNLKWREENHIDEILNEDFSYFEERFPFWFDGRDKAERPVGTGPVALWNMRSPVVAGKRDELLRFSVRVMEQASKMIRDDQANGRNVTQISAIADLKGFNLVQHACIQCFPMYIEFLTIYENYYPGLVHKLFMVNTPPSFEIMIRIARPVISPQTRKAWEIYGANRKQWTNAVLEEIDSDQIREQFGGNKPADLDLEYSQEVFR